MKASFTEFEKIRKQLIEELIKEAENRGYRVYSVSLGALIKDVADKMHYVRQVAIQLRSFFDYQHKEVFFGYGVDFFDSDLHFSEGNKVASKRFETASEAMDFIEERAKRINDFFESLD